LLLDQAYRLAFWRVAADEINYRRFFDINELAAICIENPAVFERTHDLVLLLLRDGLVDGLRIDHPDGLYDPRDYFERLQRARFLQLCREVSSVSQDDVVIAQPGDEFDEPDESVLDRQDTERKWEFTEPTLLAAREDQRIEGGKHSPLAQPLYLVVEKILGRGEQLPEEWPVQGTTGYDFLNAVNGLFVDRNNAKAIDAIYARFLREPTDFKDLLYRCKKLILDASMSSELSVLGHQLDRISERDRRARDFTLRSLTQVIGEVIACFPVYRTYITDADVSERDRRYVELAVARAKRKAPAVSESLFKFLRDILLLEEIDQADEITRAQQRRFVSRFQQFTSPIMAKAVEDTAFYIFNRLVSLNEVGGDPEVFGISPGTFHQQNLQRQSHWPHSLLATSTHDTKRSEDVRSRINVLSEIPQEWRNYAFRWSRMNQRKKSEVDGEPAPSRNDEYLLYQTLLGTWPTEPMSREQREKYIERIQQYMVKAMHEAKVHTSWISPHVQYEAATRQFINALLDDSRRNAFLESFDGFARRVARFGLWNSLSQTLLKLTCPGVPDIYQGTELWDFSLVDPDNRRPVDFADHQRRLVSTIQLTAADGRFGEVAHELIATCNDGRIKLFIIRQVLNHRRSHPELYAKGDYVPLEPTGSRKEHLCAFARNSGEQSVIVVVPRLIARLVSHPDEPPIGSDVWQDTWLPLPNEMVGQRLLNVLTGETLEVSQRASISGLPLSAVLGSFPVAVLEKRNS
jgi:(1->4)-alpha-D-glucan 1-alpha-D-glucosylmutase